MACIRGWTAQRKQILSLYSKKTGSLVRNTHIHMHTHAHTHTQIFFLSFWFLPFFNCFIYLESSLKVFISSRLQVSPLLHRNGRYLPYHASHLVRKDSLHRHHWWWFSRHYVANYVTFMIEFHSVQFSSVAQSDFATPWTAARQAFLSITNSQSLLKLMSTALVMPSNHLIFCHPLLLPPSIFPSIRVFSNELVLCIRWPKYWSFSFSISPSNEYSRLISFRMDWLDLLTVQGTLKSLL